MPELPYGSMPVPGTPIGELKRWQLDIQCSRCRRHVRLNVEDVAARYPSTLRMGEVLRRLRCGGYRGDEVCGAVPSRVKLAEVSRYGKSVRKLREVTVMGG
jgi:hypothetical protein